VLRIVKRADLILQTGHISPDEILAVVKRAKQLGVRYVVATHAMASVPGMSLAQLKEAVAMGAYIELIYATHLMGPHAHLAWMRKWKQVSINDMAEVIKDIGAEHFILGSDLGQTGNPTPPDGMLKLVVGLKKAGLSEAQLDVMMRKNPAKLLGLR